MPSKVTIAKLVHASLARRTPEKIFLSLLLQTLQTDSISDNELLEGLIQLNFDGNSVAEQIELALVFAGSSIENAKTFFRLLLKLSVECQLKYLIHLKNSYSTVFNESVLQDVVSVSLPKYTSEVELIVCASGGLPTVEIRTLWSLLMFLWRSVAKTHSQMMDGALDGALLIKCSKETSFSLDYVKKTLLLVDTQAKTSELTISPGTLKSASSPESVYSLNVFSKKYSTYLKIKKVTWLTARFRTWNFNEHLLEQYASFFKIPTQNPTDVIEEIVAAFFGGILCAIELGEEPFVLFNWKNYIVSRLPNYLRLYRPLQIAGITEDIGESLLAAVMAFDTPHIVEMKIGGAKTPYDLRKKFLKSCIYLQIITLDQYAKSFSEEARLMSQSLITHEVGQLSHVDQITHEFNTKIAKVNVEFTSFEESKLIEYFQSLSNSNFEYLEDKQARLASLTNELVETCIEEKNIEKLSRLLLGFLNSLSTANFVFFCSPKGPWLILELLMQYLDDQPFSVDDDESNFQDIHASFGIILSSIIAIVCFFGVDFEHLNVQLSYTIDYINKFFFRLADSLSGSITGTDDDDNTIISNYNTLMADWVASLFDVNNEGLSDELLKSVNVKQIYKFMLIIFQQAISARIVNVLSSASINNGIDYLSQNFLAPCSVEIIKWISSRIDSGQMHSEALSEIILKIIESNMGSDQASNLNGPNFIFRMITNIVAPFLKLAISNSGTVGPNAIKLQKFLQSTADLEYCGYETRTAASSVEKSEARVILQGIKAELALIVKKPPVEATALALVWARFKQKLRRITTLNISDTVLEELSKCAKAPLHAQSEDSRLLVDFLLFSLSVDSCPTLDTAQWHLVALEKLKLQPTLSCKAAHADAGEVGFQASMDQHYLSIFNEGIPLGSPAATGSAPEFKDEFEPKDDLMGFDTDDLFNDMPQDLFEEPMGIIAPASTAPQTHPLPQAGLSLSRTSVLGSYLEMWCMQSPLFQVMEYLAISAVYDPEWERIFTVAKTKIRLDIDACIKGLCN
ncbi:hypothetical protein PUMCH_005064 [Australozyma saopauloensis]|uniref:Mediator of RNA polymerase II transcription subunit 5 n=1 Tax=Australozyma saopauloensis TaxID=291208 RepID=A0AAX4HH54_9ASCO|nr:hypothetical protein PUMCH_005064 [[Candida] saopauloensis]